MKIKNILIALVSIIMLATACSYFGGGLSEKKIAGTWSRPIESGGNMTVTNDDGTTSTVSMGPVSDEFMRFNEDMTFQMWEKPRSGNPDFYNVSGTWKIAEDKKSVDIFTNGNTSNLPIKEITESNFTTISQQGRDLVFTKQN
jgi:hypothetical protein